jgi:hypothetical protein
MIYFKNASGEVFAYETQVERDQYGAPDLLLMTENEVENHLNPSVLPIIPRIITMRQARLLLNSMGLLNQVQNAIDALPEPPRVAAQIEWDYSSEVHRNKEFVTMIAQQLDLTDSQIDQMFIEASQL